MTTTSRDRHARREFWRSRWWMPGFCLFLGALMLAAFAIGGETGSGVGAFGVMVVAGSVFLLGSRSETLRGLGGPGRDERWASIDTRASAGAGLTTITVILGAWLWQIANGEDGSPYGQLAAVAGISYMVAVVLLRWRS